MAYARSHLGNYHLLETFFADAKAGNLPNYTFLDPRYFDFFGVDATDQHPDHDVGAGEQLISDVYEALRASPVWNETLFLITYDEHGGACDKPACRINPCSHVALI